MPVIYAKRAVAKLTAPLWAIFGAKMSWKDSVTTSSDTSSKHLKLQMWLNFNKQILDLLKVTDRASCYKDYH